MCVYEKIIGVIISIFFIFSLVGCGSSNSSYESRSNGYSDTYNNNSEYRSNVDDIANEYGTSSSEVDAKINAITGGR